MKTRKQIIEDMLLSVGIQPNQSGFAGIVTMTLLWMDAQDHGDPCPAFCVLYHKAARALDTTSSRLERAIRHAIEVMFDRTEPDELARRFPSQTSMRKGKYTNSEFVSMLALLVRREEGGSDG